MTRVFSSLRTTAGRFAVNFALLALLALVMLVSMRFGSLKLTFAEIVGTLWNRPDGINGQIIFNIRLPRILLGALVGGSLAAAGTILQGVMRNPLASPGIIGVSAGGGGSSPNDISSFSDNASSEAAVSSVPAAGDGALSSAFTSSPPP